MKVDRGAADKRFKITTDGISLRKEGAILLQQSPLAASPFQEGLGVLDFSILSHEPIIRG